MGNTMPQSSATASMLPVPGKQGECTTAPPTCPRQVPPDLLRHLRQEDWDVRVVPRLDPLMRSYPGGRSLLVGLAAGLAIACIVLGALVAAGKSELAWKIPAVFLVAALLPVGLAFAVLTARADRRIREECVRLSQEFESCKISFELRKGGYKHKSRWLAVHHPNNEP